MNYSFIQLQFRKIGIKFLKVQLSFLVNLRANLLVFICKLFNTLIPVYLKL